MKILLIGEYSNLHNSLKKGLQKNGFEVVLLATGDGFKNFDSDILVKSSLFENKFLKVIAKLIDRLIGVSLNEIEIFIKAIFKINKLKGFDVVQLINERAFGTSPELEKTLLKYIFENNKKVFLLACGVDTVSIKHASEKKFRYSILSPYFENKNLNREFKHTIKYLNSNYLMLGEYVRANVKGIISSDLDYHIPYENFNKYLGMIPNPINIDKLKKSEINEKNKIFILHAINSKNKIKKGNEFFEKSLILIEEKYKNKIKIVKTIDRPYSEHIINVNECDILLDQVYAYDQGYNALEAMALGKVVFTGAEKEWVEFYNIKEDSVAINALPDISKIVEKLSWLIENPLQLKSISKNARKFIEEHHDYKKIANKYLKTWNTK
ncbi:MAG: glycosyltransferase [Flavobacteriaceae bacterium]